MLPEVEPRLELPERALLLARLAGELRRAFEAHAAAGDQRLELASARRQLLLDPAGFLGAPLELCALGARELTLGA